MGAPKSHNNVTSIFSAAHLLPKDLGFERGSAKRLSCSGCHLTLLRPCLWLC